MRAEEQPDVAPGELPWMASVLRHGWPIDPRPASSEESAKSVAEATLKSVHSEYVQRLREAKWIESTSSEEDWEAQRRQFLPLEEET